MLIEHTLKREGGTQVPIGRGSDAITYHFKPEDGVFTSPHVCEVDDADHLVIFLSNKAFRPAAGVPVEAIPVIAATPLMTAHVDPLQLRQDQPLLALADVVAQVMAQHKLSVNAWNELGEVGRTDLVEAWLSTERSTLAPIIDTDDEDDTAGGEVPARGDSAALSEEQRLKDGGTEGGAAPKKLAEMTDKKLKATAAKYGVNAELPRAELIAALAVYVPQAA